MTARREVTADDLTDEMIREAMSLGDTPLTGNGFVAACTASMADQLEAARAHIAELKAALARPADPVSTPLACAVGSENRPHERRDIVTEYDLDASDPERRAWVEQVHAARVQLESLDAERRQRAYDWLADHDHDPDAAAVAIRRAIVVATA